jgi:hypothetical protein
MMAKPNFCSSASHAPKASLALMLPAGMAR